MLNTRLLPIGAQNHQKRSTGSNYSAVFVKFALQYRDTHDAYSMDDGDRLFKNSKFLPFALALLQEASQMESNWEDLIGEKAVFLKDGEDVTAKIGKRRFV